MYSGDRDSISLPVVSQRQEAEGNLANGAQRTEEPCRGTTYLALVALYELSMPHIYNVKCMLNNLAWECVDCTQPGCLRALVCQIFFFFCLSTPGPPGGVENSDSRNRSIHGPPGNRNLFSGNRNLSINLVIFTV